MGCSGERALNVKLENLKKEIIGYKNSNYEKQIENLEKENKDLKSKIESLENNNRQYNNQNQNLEKNINQVNKEIKDLKKNQNKISGLELKIDKFEKEKEISKQKEIESIKLKESNNNKMNKIISDVKDLKSELNNNNNKENIQNMELSIKQMKKENKDLNEKINNLVNQIEQLKNEHEQIKYINKNNNENKMDIEETINSNLTLRENGMNQVKLSKNEMIEMIKDKSSIKRELGKFKNKENLGGNQNNDNKFINNFVDQQIINICFKINSQICLSIQANPSDRFKDLFIAAIKKNNFNYPDNDINLFKFYYGPKNVSTYFINNDKIDSLYLKNICIIDVYTS